MVNRQQQRGNSRRERKRVNTRCLGCGYGCGQFGVEYCTDEDNGSGRGYCSLDCYTSAKVRGLEMDGARERACSKSAVAACATCARWVSFFLFGGVSEPAPRV